MTRIRRRNLSSVLGSRSKIFNSLSGPTKHMASDVSIATPSIVAEQVEDYELMKFVMQNDTISLVHRSVDINVDRYKLIELLESYNFRVVNTNKSTFFAVGDAQFVTVDIRNWSTTVNIVATTDQSKKFIDMMINTFEHNPCYVKYVYDSQYMEYTTLPINSSKQPIQEMYPWLDEPITNFYDRFVNSDSNILILTGVPGSGKCLDPEEVIEVLISDDLYEKALSLGLA